MKKNIFIKLISKFYFKKDCIVLYNKRNKLFLFEENEINYEDDWRILNYSDHTLDLL